ncbi:MAG: FHA domain-containing protein [bacterium]|nr:FHA domain-containing protein [bacterium]
MASLDIQSGPAPGRRFSLGSRSVMIGRDASCTIEIEDELVSRRHLQIVYDSCRARHCAVDVGSSNGVFVNGARVERGTVCVLEDGDEIAAHTPTPPIVRGRVAYAARWVGRAP